MDYRNKARKCLSRAEIELSTNDDNRLRYAALEIRLALESLIYQKASIYKTELPEKILKTWQPRRLLAALIEIDPYADSSPIIQFGKEAKFGVAAQESEMILMGKDRNLSLKEIKDYYDKIGSYLHVPTLYQTDQGKFADSNKIRNRCNEVVNILKEVFASKVFNSDFKQTLSLQCKKCNSEIVRRVPLKKDTFIINCLECVASYEIRKTKASEEYEWQSMCTEIDCQTETCSAKTVLWKNEIVLDKHWECGGCKSRYSLKFTAIKS